ncbi:hypothetical protein [Pleurocapsa sp. CCALA 161]|uniref:hypothetical protein n=1 Tax=Pleurocapsa sp. CCALA 161 TaxID=2107688 RepID=UPI0011B2855E|nr:hypothetical protein [Pleurocapsa sp. CCALA 161]
MLRDISRCQVIQKFSFIESLSLSRSRNHHFQANLGQFNTNQTHSFQQQRRSNDHQLTTKTSKQPSAIVTTSNRATTIDSNWYQATTDYNLSLAEIIRVTTDNYVEPNLRSSLNSSTRSSYLGKILFSLACSYCLLVAWWLLRHQGILTAIAGGKNVVLSKSDVQFIDYMERSLDQIDRKIATHKKTNEQVVYVPLYTPAPTMPQVASNNVPLALPNSSIPDLPPPAEPLAIPEPPPLPEPTPINNNVANSAQSNPVAIASKPKISHTLMGVLQLGGDRSAALIKVQGQTRRVWAGEEINDGWILESIANQQANISYQGEVRSISVGETF